MEQYKALAEYYGELCQDMEAIKMWKEFTDKHGKGNHFLELACGSGDLANLLQSEGREIYATDLSDEMIAKGKSTYPSIHFDVMDMRHIKYNECFDTILCFCDSINYLESLVELEQMIDEVSAHLSEKGVFLFDMHSLDRLEEFEEEWIEEGEMSDGTGYQWSIMATDGRLYQHLAFYFEKDFQQETHIQVVFDPMDVKSILEKKGFDVTFYTDFIHEGLVEGEKYFVVAKKR